MHVANINVDLLTYNGQIGPQYYDQQSNQMRPITREVLREMIVTNFPSLMNVEDEQVKEKIDELINKLPNQEQYFGVSSETKPTAEVVGSTFFEVDTTDAYMWDGNQWRLI